MLCSNCESEISDDALICFRCGEATSVNERKPTVIEKRGGGRSGRGILVPLLLSVVFVAVSAFFMTELAGGTPPAPLVWLMLAMAGGLLAWRASLR